MAEALGNKPAWVLIDNFSDGNYTTNPVWGNGGSYPGFSVVSSDLIGSTPEYSLYTPFGSSAGGTWAADMSWTSGLTEFGFTYPTGTHINPQPRFYYGIQVDGSTLYLTQGTGGATETSPATYATIASTAWAPTSGTYYAYRIQWNGTTGATTVFINGVSKLTGTQVWDGQNAGAEVFTAGTAGWTNFYFNSNTTAGASPIG